MIEYELQVVTPHWQVALVDLMNRRLVAFFMAYSENQHEIAVNNIYSDSTNPSTLQTASLKAG